MGRSEVTGAPGNTLTREHGIGEGDRAGTELRNPAGLKQGVEPIGAEVDSAEVGGIEGQVGRAVVRSAFRARPPTKQFDLSIVPWTEAVAHAEGEA